MKQKLSHLLLWVSTIFLIAHNLMPHTHGEVIVNHNQIDTPTCDGHSNNFWHLAQDVFTQNIGIEHLEHFTIEDTQEVIDIPVLVATIFEIQKKIIVVTNNENFPTFNFAYKSPPDFTFGLRAPPSDLI